MHNADYEAYYFGCWGQAGHNYFTPNMRSATYKSKPPTPWGWSIDSRDFDVEGGWHMKKEAGWTAIGTRDRSVDTRSGSISVFIFRADLTYEEAVSAAMVTFPQVFTRMRPTYVPTGRRSEDG